LSAFLREEELLSGNPILGSLQETIQIGSQEATSSTRGFHAGDLSGIRPAPEGCKVDPKVFCRFTQAQPFLFIFAMLIHYHHVYFYAFLIISTLSIV
jgi:hypothetical protein